VGPCLWIFGFFCLTFVAKGNSPDYAELLPPWSAAGRYPIRDSSQLKRKDLIGGEQPGIKRAAVGVSFSRPYFNRNLQHQDPMLHYPAPSSGNDTNHLTLDSPGSIYKRLNLQVLEGNPRRADGMSKTLLNIELLPLIPLAFKQDFPARERKKSWKASKGGCSSCKKRHVKCDEKKPFCKSFLQFIAYS
jgi:hypothetical protein